MDNRPVGVFDSGLGGLTAARKIRSILPSDPKSSKGPTPGRGNMPGKGSTA